MSLTSLVRHTVYATDVDALLPHYGVLAGRLGAAGAAPATTLLGVTRLAVPGQLVELEGTAVASPPRPHVSGVVLPTGFEPALRRF